MISNSLVIIRTRDAGVHVGVLASYDAAARAVTLSDSRRLWRWRGANTLNEVALHGVAEEYTRLSQPVPAIVILDVCEVIPVAASAAASLTTSRWPT
jgi:hypothetical protein